MTKTTLHGWKLREAKGFSVEDAFASAADDGWFGSEDAASVHEILLDHHVLDPKIKLGQCESCVWVAESDWIYAADFELPGGERAERYELFFGGLDTVADLYLNGEHIAFHDNFYTTAQLDVTAKIKPRNRLVLHFHSPYKVMAERAEQMPEQWKGVIAPHKLVCKPAIDFSRYLGGRPYLTTMGLYADVELRLYGKARIELLDVGYYFSSHYEWAEVSPKLCALGGGESLRAEFLLYGPDGELAAKAGTAIAAGTASAELRVEAPRMWYPFPYGEHPLYRLVTRLFDGEALLDEDEKKIGLREIRRVGDMKFTVNGALIKMWGSNLVPLSGISHRWDSERGRKVLAMTAAANINLLRIWGEGAPYSEELYDFADEHGILIWQEMFSQYGCWPDDESYRKQNARACEQLILRLRHRACLLMWCGNNEAYMFGEGQGENNRQIGYKIFMHDFAEAAKRLDPGRYYHASSPMGGLYPNDAQGGDTHSYSGGGYVAGLEHPVFLSENCYTTALSLKSMRRFMTEEEIFPKGYVNALYASAPNPRFESTMNSLWFRYWRNLPVPPSWYEFMDEFSHCEYWGVENYYDAADARELVYRFSACADAFFKRTVETLRRGKPLPNGTGDRVAQGHLSWKLNDAFPMISFTLIDCFLEPTRPYFALGRAYAPVILSIEVGDHVNLWGVNDTLCDIEARLVFKAYSRVHDRLDREFELPVFLRAGESRIFTDLDRMGGIVRECVLYAALVGKDGEIIARADQSFDIERDSYFPPARLTIAARGDTLTVTTDRYAHCVELAGGENGDEFGWVFEDNYFNLLPFETKTVRVKAPGSGGVVTARAFYSPHTSAVQWKAD